MSDPYVYPGTDVLINLPGINDAEIVKRLEREYYVRRVQEGVPSGNFDLKHVKAIHKHLFQDMYGWAGEIRTVRMNKGDSQFQFPSYIERGMEDVHNRLKKANFLRNLSAEDFSKEAGKIIGDVNHAHPFREGNGRVQVQYLKQLAEQAGYPIEINNIDREKWMEASKQGNLAKYDLMAELIHENVKEVREKKIRLKDFEQKEPSETKELDQKKIQVGNKEEIKKPEKKERITKTDGEKKQATIEKQPEPSKKGPSGGGKKKEVPKRPEKVKSPDVKKNPPKQIPKQISQSVGKPKHPVGEKKVEKPAPKQIPKKSFPQKNELPKKRAEPEIKKKPPAVKNAPKLEQKPLPKKVAGKSPVELKSRPKNKIYGVNRARGRSLSERRRKGLSPKQKQQERIKQVVQVRQKQLQARPPQKAPPVVMRRR